MRAVLAFLALCALVQARQTPSLDPSSDSTSTSNLKNSFAPYIDTAKRTAEEQAPACPDATALGLQLTQARQELLNKQNYITRVQNQNTELSQTVASLTSQLQAVKEPAAQFEITRRVHEAQITQYKEMSVVQTASLARLVKQVSRQNAELVALRRRDEHNSAALVTKSRQLDLALKQVAELGEKLVAANNRLQQLTVLYGDANNKLQKLNATREDQRLALQTAEHNHRDALFAYDQATEQNKNFRTVINLVQTQLNDTQTKLQQCQTEKEALQNQLTPKVSAKDFMNSLTQPNPNLNVRVN